MGEVECWVGGWAVSFFGLRGLGTFGGRGNVSRGGGDWGGGEV